MINKVTYSAGVETNKMITISYEEPKISEGAIIVGSTKKKVSLSISKKEMDQMKYKLSIELIEIDKEGQLVWQIKINDKTLRGFGLYGPIIFIDRQKFEVEPLGNNAVVIKSDSYATVKVNIPCIPIDPASSTYNCDIEFPYSP
ncbi:MAG: hypothetical protein AAGG81_07345 [Chlamydiota bacterium]